MWIALLTVTVGYAQTEPDAPPTPAPAPAAGPSAEDMAEAKRLYENGERLYEEALYEQAILAFRGSYELSGQHALLFNIASAQERMGDLKGAVTTLNTYRVYADAEEQSKLDRRVRTLENRIDELAAAAVPVPTPVPTPTPAPVVPQVVTRSNPPKWITLGAGIGTTVVFGSLSGVTYASGRAAIDRGDETAYNGSRSLNNLSLGLTVAGLGLTAVGVALPAQREFTVGASLTPRDAHVTASWSF